MTRPTMSACVVAAKRELLMEKHGTAPSSNYVSAPYTFRMLLDQYPATALMAAAIAITDLTGSQVGAGSAAALDALDINNFLNL